jgi:integrase
MSFAYWDGGKLKLGFKVGKTWRYKRVPQEIKALEKSEPDRAFDLAKKLAEEIDRQSAAAIETWGSDHVTLRMFLKKFIDDRRSAGLVSVDDDESRLKNHVLTEPVVDMLIRDIRPRHTRPLLIKLNAKVSEKKLAPRTSSHVWSLMHTAFEVAIEEELASENPFRLRKGHKLRPRKRDKDPKWRQRARYAASELLLLFNDARVPDDRRVFWILEFYMGGPRFGEAAAIRWEDHVHAWPLTKICVAQSYNTKKRRVKETKTEVPREVPVHPELLRVLDWWRREGWERLMGCPPRPEDLIVPSRRGNHRNVNHMGRRLHEDLERLGLRQRNQHDFRRTFISLAQECGANVPLLKWITHGNARSTIMDDYSAISWEARCAEMQKVDLRACAAKETPTEGGILNAAIADSATSPVVVLPTEPKTTNAPSTSNGALPPGILPGPQRPGSSWVKSRSGRDSKTFLRRASRGLSMIVGVQGRDRSGVVSRDCHRLRTLEASRCLCW